VKKNKERNMSKTILVVDDNPNILTTLADILMEKGYNVVKADSGKKALKKIDRETADLILLDTKMPDMDGFEICRQIKKVKALSSKVIIYTAHIDAIDVLKAIRSGADDYCIKTDNFSDILKTIEDNI